MCSRDLKDSIPGILPCSPEKGEHTRFLDECALPLWPTCGQGSIHETCRDFQKEHDSSRKCDAHVQKDVVGLDPRHLTDLAHQGGPDLMTTYAMRSLVDKGKVQQRRDEGR